MPRFEKGSYRIHESYAWVKLSKVLLVIHPIQFASEEGKVWLIPNVEVCRWTLSCVCPIASLYSILYTCNLIKRKSSLSLRWLTSILLYMMMFVDEIKFLWCHYWPSPLFFPSFPFSLPRSPNHTGNRTCIRSSGISPWTCSSWLSIEVVHQSEDCGIDWDTSWTLLGIPCIRPR